MGDWLHDQGLEALADADTGELERAVTADGWRRPRSVELVEAEGGPLLTYVPDWRGAGPKLGPGAQLLERFCRLSEASPEAILAFAREWGMLTLCAHAVPVGAGPLCAQGVGPGRCRPLAWWGSGRGAGVPFEPVAAWRHYAAQARAMLDLAVALKRGALGDDRDWERAYEWVASGAHAHGGAQVDLRTGALAVAPPPERPGPWWDRTLDADRATLSFLVHEWRDLGRVGFVHTWEGEVPRLRLGGHGLFGAVATQLLFAIGAAKGLVTCTVCGELYTPTRRPRADQANYCPQCSWRESRRLAQQRYRRKRGESAPGATASDRRRGRPRR